MALLCLLPSSSSGAWEVWEEEGSGGQATERPRDPGSAGGVFLGGAGRWWLPEGQATS